MIWDILELIIIILDLFFDRNKKDDKETKEHSKSLK